MSEEKKEPITYKEAYETMRINLDFVRAELMGFAIGRPECDFNPVIDRIEEAIKETRIKLNSKTMSATDETGDELEKLKKVATGIEYIQKLTGRKVTSFKVSEEEALITFENVVAKECGGS